jgi:hypothetical protein
MKTRCRKIISLNGCESSLLTKVLHKKLEKEIHPVEVKVTTTSREDVWGLRLVQLRLSFPWLCSFMFTVVLYRFLNMLSSLQALLDIGKCRELPVVGFVRGYMVVGVIVSTLSALNGVCTMLNGGVTGRAGAREVTNIITRTDSKLTRTEIPAIIDFVLCVKSYTSNRDSSQETYPSTSPFGLQDKGEWNLAEERQR